MHYYQHNIGDYARDTSHLSMLEHGIYRTLLDWCYLNEKPITTEKAIRLSRGNPVETQSVLSEFFLQCEDGWTHARVVREIEKFHLQAEKNRQNGVKGGRPRSQNNPLGSQSVPSGNPVVTLTKNQEPISNNQKIKDSCPADAEPVKAQTRFGEFWAAYPDKTGKKPSFEKWKAKRLDTLADQIIADVAGRKLKDRKWLDGFIPNPLTYLNQERWNDPIQEARPVQQQTRPMSKQAQGMQAILDMRKRYGLDSGRSDKGAGAAVLALPGINAIGRASGSDDSDMGGDDCIEGHLV